MRETKDGRIMENKQHSFAFSSHRQAHTMFTKEKWDRDTSGRIHVGRKTQNLHQPKPTKAAGNDGCRK